MWKYEVSNTDHTLMQGVELVNAWLLGEPETTIGIKYESTLDGRQAAVHERSSLAGSGDPKKARERELIARELSASAAASTSKLHAIAPVAPLPGKDDARSGSSSIKHIAAGLEKSAPRRKPGTGGPGDKNEVHVSEEELGVTTPLEEEAQS
jgi:hypothetical protein